MDEPSRIRFFLLPDFGETSRIRIFIVAGFWRMSRPESGFLLLPDSGGRVVQNPDFYCCRILVDESSRIRFFVAGFSPTNRPYSGFVSVAGFWHINHPESGFQ